MKNITITVIILLFMVSALAVSPTLAKGKDKNNSNDKIAEKTLKGTITKKELSWEELTREFKCPAWYSEAKFGIWAHWGAQVQPERGGSCYARHMYMQDVGHAKWVRKLMNITTRPMDIHRNRDSRT